MTGSGNQNRRVALHVFPWLRDNNRIPYPNTVTFILLPSVVSKTKTLSRFQGFPIPATNRKPNRQIDPDKRMELQFKCLMSAGYNKGLLVVVRRQYTAYMEFVRKELLQGTLDLLILKTLSTAQLHGWDIAKRIAVVSQDRLSLKQGSLYPALHRLENRGWIEAEWGVSDAGRSAKFYRLTRIGKKHLVQEKNQWQTFATDMANIMNMEELT